jgi:hypothetical protein
MGLIQSVSTHHGESAAKGFQFGFACAKSGAGYRAKFRLCLSGMLSEVHDAVGSVLGGLFNTSASPATCSNTLARGELRRIK